MRLVGDLGNSPVVKRSTGGSFVISPEQREQASRLLTLFRDGKRNGSVAQVQPKTVGESLYWSYANLSMAFASSKHSEATYQQIDFIVRNKIYYGLVSGRMKPRSLFNDEREKIWSAGMCAYCGNAVNLSVDHLIPRLRGGDDEASNLVTACRSCNSSKGARDLLEWMALRGVFPTLVLLRRYLKLAIKYCIKNNVMDIALEEVNSIDPVLPFSFYNNDRTKIFRVVIEGMTTNGKLFSIEKLVTK